MQELDCDREERIQRRIEQLMRRSLDLPSPERDEDRSSIESTTLTPLELLAILAASALLALLALRDKWSPAGGIVSDEAPATGDAV